jgi:hypothetical protein
MRHFRVTVQFDLQIGQIALSRASFGQQWQCQFNVKEGELQVNIHKQGSLDKTQMLNSKHKRHGKGKPSDTEADRGGGKRLLAYRSP